MADILRIKRRATGGGAGAPSALANGELAYNEQDNTLYYGNGGTSVLAASILPIAGPGAFLRLTGGAMAGGLGFGSAVATGNTDVTRHLALYSNTFGLGITASRLNLVSPSATVFVNAGVDVLNVGTASITANKPVVLPNLVPLALSSAGSTTLIQAPGQDGANMWACNMSLASFNGVGVTSGIANQRIPLGLHAISFDARQGHINALGNILGFNCTQNQSSQIQTLRFVVSGTDQIVDHSQLIASLTSDIPVTGGINWSVNDRLYDQSFNTYTVLATDGAGVVTSLRMDTASARQAAPSNPVTLFATAGFTGSGVTANLTYTRLARLVIRSANNPMLIQATALTFTGAASFTSAVTLAADPTVALGAATKQYADTFLSRSGGTMTGALTLSADPTVALGAATKQYADTFLSRSGGTMTGALTLSANPTVALGAATRQYVDSAPFVSLAGGTMTGALTLSGAPTASLHAASKAYVDAATAALDARIAYIEANFIKPS